MTNGDFEGGSWTGTTYVQGLAGNETSYAPGWTFTTPANTGLSKASGTFVALQHKFFNDSTYIFFKPTSAGTIPAIAQNLAVATPGVYRLKLDYTVRPGYYLGLTTYAVFTNETVLTMTTDATTVNLLEKKYADITINQPGTYKLKFYATATADRASVLDNIEFRLLETFPSLEIGGAPVAPSTPEPDYGTVVHTVGDVIPCSAPGTATLGGVNFRRTGWKYYENGELLNTADTASTNITIKAATASKLVWQWAVDYGDTVTLKADGSGDYATLEAAIAGLGSAGGEIVLEPGDYPVTDVVVVPHVFKIRSASGNPGDTSVYARGAAGLHAAFVVSNDYAVISGLAISNGYVNADSWLKRAGNITLYAGTVTNCHIAYGTAASTTASSHNILAGGAAVYGGTLSGCLIHANKNTQDTYGDAACGIGVKGTGAVVENCEISGNASAQTYCRGGGLKLIYGLVRNCVITNNDITGYGAGAYVAGGRLERCLVAGNTGSRTEERGGGLHVVTENNRVPVIRNCTVTRNRAFRWSGIYANGSTPKFENCISWGNIDVGPDYTGRPDIANGSSASTMNCCYSITLSGTSLGVDPCFADPGNGDYRLAAHSPCIDAGYTRAGDDYSGDAIDIGCHEYPRGDYAATISTSALFPVKPGTVAFTGRALGFDGPPAAVNWKLDRLSPAEDGVWETGTLDQTLSLASAGMYRISLKVSDGSHEATASRTFEIGAPDVYLAPAGTPGVTPAAPYATAATATNDFLEALKYCADDSTLHVADGDYALTDEALVAKKVLIVSENGPDKTSLYRPGPLRSGTARRVLRVEHADAVVSGFAITNGYGQAGYDIALRAGSVTNCFVGFGGTDAAVLILAGRLVESTVAGCQAGDGRTLGVAVGLLGAAARLEGCVIRDNRVTGNYYSGSPVRASAGMIDRCIFSNNSMAGYRAGAVSFCGTALIDNSLFYGNTNTYNGAGAVTISANGFTIRNCTFVKNRGPKTGGIHFSQNDSDSVYSGALVNNIFWNNFGTSAAASEHDFVKQGPKIVWTNNSVSVETAVLGTGGIWGDPWFADAGAGNFTLQSKSPCRNTGFLYDGLGPRDLAGLDRVREDKVDMGCHEFVPSEDLAAFYTVELPTTPGGVPTFTATATGADLTGLQYRWRLTDAVSGLAGEWTEWSSESVYAPASMPSGRYGLELEIRNHEAAEGCETAGFSNDGATFCLPEAHLYLVPPDTEGHVAREPYNTEATAATNLVEAAHYFGDGTLVMVLPGEHPVTDNVATARRITIRGENPSTTRLYRSGADFSLLTLYSDGGRVEGVTVSGGKVPDSGAGANVYLDGGTISNCVISASTGPAVTSVGGKIYDTLFTNNCSRSYTATHLNQSGAEAVTERCRFVGGRSAGYYSGGNILVSGGRLARCEILHNYMAVNPSAADTGGTPVSGVGLSGGAVLENCLVAHNRCVSRGAVSLSGAAVVLHCTIVSNLCSGVANQGGAGFSIVGSVGAGLKAGITNCIAWGNVNLADRAYDNYYFTSTLDMAVAYTLGDNLPSSATGCFFADPRFKDASSGDYRLANTSPCVNGGIKYAGIRDSVDLAGRKRVLGGAPDLGCYESNAGGATMLFIR